MDKATFRILDTISSNIGDPLSINQLTNRMKDRYGSAYYANTYEKLQDLKNNGLINIEPIGRSSSIQLNFENYLVIDTLSAMEIEKKIEFLSARKNLLPFFADMDKTLRDSAIKSISAINPQKNIKLNRIELLLLLNEAPDYLKQTVELHKATQDLQRKHNLKTNNLTLDKDSFLRMLSSNEVNPVREALANQNVLFNPQAFWSQIKEIAQKNQIRTLHQETKPLSISDSDLNFNLNRFGYSEFGTSFAQGRKFCIEYIVTSLLLREEARGVDAAAVILAKNSFSSGGIAFLSQKFEVSSRLLGILEVLRLIKPRMEIENAEKILKTINPQMIAADEDSIKQKLELYNAL